MFIALRVVVYNWAVNPPILNQNNWLVSQTGKNAGQILSVLEWLLRGFCMLCSTGTCLAQKETARSDSRASSRRGAEGDRRHAAWASVLGWQQKWGADGRGKSRVLAGAGRQLLLLPEGESQSAQACAWCAGTT